MFSVLFRSRKLSGWGQLFFAVSTILLITLQTGSAANPLDTWHQRPCPLASTPLTAIAYGNGRFLAVADALNRFLTSTNGTDWEIHPAPYPNFKTVTFGNGLFIVAFAPNFGSQPQRIYTSPDGVAWTLRFVAQDSDVTDIRALETGAGKVVAAGTGVWISLDLTNWTVSSYETVSFTDIAFLNGNFVAVDGSALWSSPDANAWTYRNSSFGGARVVAGNGKFCSVGYPSGRTLLSGDGVSWTQSPTTNVPVPFTLGPLAFAGGYFVALANGAGSNLMVSTNGQDWDLHSFGTNWTANGIAFGNNTFVAVGNGSVILQSDVLTSSLITQPTLAMSQVPSLTITGETGRDYRIEYTDNLADANSFLPLTIVHMESSQTTWVDTTATNAARRFYRAAVIMP
jgi:hypothetical protein